MRYLTAAIVLPFVMIFDLLSLPFSLFMILFHDDWPFTYRFIKMIWGLNAGTA